MVWGLACGSKDQWSMVGRRESGEGMGPGEEAGREPAYTHIPCSVPVTHTQSHTFTPVLLVKKENKSLLNVLSPSDLCLPLLSYSLRQTLCCSNVCRDDMVACTPLCVDIVGLLLQGSCS